tara:strand:- start:233 stop:442 length:210 start_codon:yes stop_codon:yes gene_type:complete
MADYNSSNTNVKVFIHDPRGGDKSSATGHIAKDIYDYIVGLDSTNNKIISVTHSPMNGERVMTMIVSGS